MLALHRYGKYFRSLFLPLLPFVRFVVKTFLQNLLYLYYHKFPVFFLDHKITTQLSGKMWVFVHIGIHNSSRKFHLSKLDFTKIKTNNIRMKTMTPMVLFSLAKVLMLTSVPVLAPGPFTWLQGEVMGQWSWPSYRGGPEWACTMRRATCPCTGAWGEGRP